MKKENSSMDFSTPEKMARARNRIVTSILMHWMFKSDTTFIFVIGAENIDKGIKRNDGYTMLDLSKAVQGLEADNIPLLLKEVMAEYLKANDDKKITFTITKALGSIKVNSILFPIVCIVYSESVYGIDLKLYSQQIDEEGKVQYVNVISTVFGDDKDSKESFTEDFIKQIKTGLYKP